MSGKLFFFLSFTLLIFAFASCTKSDDNQITISFISPTDNAIIADKSSVLIHVNFVASDENHMVRVILHPDDNISDKIIDWDQHSHDKTIEFKQTVDLSSFPSGTKFHLEATACADHDCATEVEDDILFSIQ